MPERPTPSTGTSVGATTGGFSVSIMVAMGEPGPNVLSTTVGIARRGGTVASAGSAPYQGVVLRRPLLAAKPAGPAASTIQYW